VSKTESLLECSLEGTCLVEAVMMKECEVPEKWYAVKITRSECPAAELDESVTTL
jgi:hypothetical protein